MKVRMARAGLLGIIPMLLAGCGESDMTDLKNYVNEVKARPRGAIEPLPEVRTVEPFAFSADSVRDPFVVEERDSEPEETKVESGIRPDTTRPKEELESFDLDSLRMVGTVTRDGTLWALVRAGDGTIHRVRPGNHMGRNYGKITTIKDGMIELIEIVSDGPGSWVERKASIELSEASMAGGNK